MTERRQTRTLDEDFRRRMQDPEFVRWYFTSMEQERIAVRRQLYSPFRLFWRVWYRWFGGTRCERWQPHRR